MFRSQAVKHLVWSVYISQFGTVPNFIRPGPCTCQQAWFWSRPNFGLLTLYRHKFGQYSGTIRIWSGPNWFCKWGQYHSEVWKKKWVKAQHCIPTKCKSSKDSDQPAHLLYSHANWITKTDTDQTAQMCRLLLCLAMAIRLFSVSVSF